MLESEDVMSGSENQLERLLEIMRRLRSPEGCPWDQKQSSDSIKMYAIEEAYELVEAIENGSVSELEEELGDLLLQVVFHAQIQSEAGLFDFEDVARGISEKLVRRHPHVFGHTAVSGADEVLTNWDTIKREEKAEKGEASSILEGVPRALPSLQRAHEVQKRAARAGFDWATSEDVLAKLEEEITEVREAIQSGNEDALKEELGDLLFSCVNMCRFLGFNAEDLLRANVEKFERRFRSVEQRVLVQGTEFSDLSIDVLDSHWEAVKGTEI